MVQADKNLLMEKVTATFLAGRSDYFPIWLLRVQQNCWNVNADMWRRLPDCGLNVLPRFPGICGETLHRFGEHESGLYVPTQNSYFDTFRQCWTALGIFIYRRRLIEDSHGLQQLQRIILSPSMLLRDSDFSSAILCILTSAIEITVEDLEWEVTLINYQVWIFIMLMEMACVTSANAVRENPF